MNDFYEPVEVGFGSWEDFGCEIELGPTIQKIVDYIDKETSGDVPDDLKESIAQTLGSSLPYCWVHYSNTGSCPNVETALIFNGPHVIQNSFALDFGPISLEIEVVLSPSAYRLNECTRQEWVDYENAKKKYEKARDKWDNDYRRAVEVEPSGDINLPQDFPPKPEPPTPPSSSRKGKRRVRFFFYDWYAVGTLFGQKARIFLYRRGQRIFTPCC